MFGRLARLVRARAASAASARLKGGGPPVSLCAGSHHTALSSSSDFRSRKFATAPTIAKTAPIGIAA